ncbi:MAG: lipoprotein-releasing ABC transporter permease subunit [Luteitalea sp.]|nr:lipoprotein-releasing ABC transporter permease subunit [Luteitalea sp.]
MPFELYVALRYLLARRKQAFISLISFISALGVAVGVMALILVLALMTGLQGELRRRIVGSQPHIYVQKVAGIDDPTTEISRLERVPHVIGAAPGVLGKAILRSEYEDAVVTVKGIDPAREIQVTDLEDAMRAGDLQALAPARDGALDSVVIGDALAENLNVKVGETVTMLTLRGSLSPMGVMPGFKRLRVAGIYSLGLFDVDAEWALLAMPVAQRVLGRASPTFVQLRVDDMYRAPHVATDIARRLGVQYVVQDWADMNQSLFSALWLEKTAMAITIGLIVVVAALNIVASLVLLVMEKTRDIAILKTMGASKRSITWIFVLQGLVIGVIGTLAGALGGVSVARVLDHYQLITIPSDVYQVSHVPFQIEASDLVIVLGGAVLVCFLATIYPSRQAARLDPAEALRYS